MKSDIIALITDFGLDDPYVGIMKGIISELSPNTALIDITHLIPPGDIQRGAFVIWQAAQDMPKGTIFLCVVDPGVGTERKGAYLQTGGQIFIGPDNGLFSYLVYNKDFSYWELSSEKYLRENTSVTFHGRDIFAPAAAYAARSISGDQFGPQIDPAHVLPAPVQVINEGSVEGEVLSQDHFGNLFTSLGLFTRAKDSLHYQSWIDESEFNINDISRIKIEAGGQELPLANTFGSIDLGMCAGLIGSTGLMEIVSNQSSAKTLLGLDKGDPVLLSWD